MSASATPGSRRASILPLFNKMTSKYEKDESCEQSSEEEPEQTPGTVPNLLAAARPALQR